MIGCKYIRIEWFIYISDLLIWKEMHFEFQVITSSVKEQMLCFDFYRIAYQSDASLSTV